MNKYQEALDRLLGITYNFPFKEWQKKDNKEMKDTLQELVDKETPMKPKQNLLLCPRCNNDIAITDYDDVTVISRDERCSSKDCGQVIDWSD